MKKALSAILCLLFVFSLCACKKDENMLIERGKIADGIYTNSFANIKFKAPENWKFASNEDLLSNTEHAGKLLDTERLQSIYEEVGLAFDMSCQSADMTHSIGLLFVNNNHEEFKKYSSTEDVLRAMIEQTTLDTGAGISEDYITLCGETYLRLCVTTKTNTGDTGYATFYGRSKGDTTIVIVFACTNAFTVADGEACFA